VPVSIVGDQVKAPAARIGMLAWLVYSALPSTSAITQFCAPTPNARTAVFASAALRA